MIRVTWPQSQIYNYLTEDEMTQYEEDGTIVYGNNCTLCIDEDCYDEITDLCWRRFHAQRRKKRNK
jgi:hypothetical protein